MNWDNNIKIVYPMYWLDLCIRNVDLCFISNDNNICWNFFSITPLIFFLIFFLNPWIYIKLFRSRLLSVQLLSTLHVQDKYSLDFIIILEQLFSVFLLVNWAIDRSVKINWSNQIQIHPSYNQFENGKACFLKVFIMVCIKKFFYFFFV